MRPPTEAFWLIHGHEFITDRFRSLRQLVWWLCTYFLYLHVSICSYLHNLASTKVRKNPQYKAGITPDTRYPLYWYFGQSVEIYMYMYADRVFLSRNVCITSDKPVLCKEISRHRDLNPGETCSAEANINLGIVRLLLRYRCMLTTSPQKQETTDTGSVCLLLRYSCMFTPPPDRQQTADPTHFQCLILPGK